MMKQSSHTLTLWLCTLLPLGGLAQDRARLIDSLAHPQVSETGAAMRFAGTTLDIGSSGKLPATILTLKGYVEPAAVPVWQYGCRMGNLILKRDEVKFTEGQKAVERIQCMNAGDSPLTVGAETALLPPYIGFRCEPETIAPGEKADLVITYDPDACGTRLLKAVPLILTGPELPPSQRTVRVLIRDASAR